MMQDWKHFINGRSVPGKDQVESFNPLSGKPAAKVARGTPEDVDQAVAAAQAAATVWGKCKPIERGRIMMKIAEVLREKTEMLAEIERSETGKPEPQSVREIGIAVQYFEYYAGLVNLFHGEVINLGEGYHSYTRREPFGVVGVITPWNGPINQAARGIAPALATGNCVVAKPSEFTSGTTALLAEIAHECGLPAGVLNVVLGLGPETGAAIVSHPGVRKVAFTGSVRAGREIGKVAGERIIPVTLELGGKSPNIMFDDADLEKAIPGAMRGFLANSGQICIGGTRILVQKGIHNEFVERLGQSVSQVAVGPEDDATMGPIITKAQWERVQSFFDIAREDGAVPVIGGAIPERPDWGDGWFIPPTIYRGVTNEMRIAREEIFGPVAVIIPFEEEAEAVRIANDTEYGLAAGIFTENLGRAHRVAAALEAGQIYVNEYFAGGVETPLGGFKNSGHGREKGIEALHHYTQLKCVTMKI